MEPRGTGVNGGQVHLALSEAVESRAQCPWIIMIECEHQRCNMMFCFVAVIGTWRLIIAENEKSGGILRVILYSLKQCRKTVECGAGDGADASTRVGTIFVDNLCCFGSGAGINTLDVLDVLACQEFLDLAPNLGVGIYGGDILHFRCIGEEVMIYGHELLGDNVELGSLKAWWDEPVSEQIVGEHNLTICGVFVRYYGVIDIPTIEGHETCRNGCLRLGIYL